jgi:hypothetical protein
VIDSLAVEFMVSVLVAILIKPLTIVLLSRMHASPVTNPLYVRPYGEN